MSKRKTKKGDPCLESRSLVRVGVRTIGCAWIGEEVHHETLVLFPSSRK